MCCDRVLIAQPTWLSPLELLGRPPSSAQRRSNSRSLGARTSSLMRICARGLQTPAGANRATWRPTREAHYPALAHGIALPRRAPNDAASAPHAFNIVVEEPHLSLSRCGAAVPANSGGRSH